MSAMERTLNGCLIALMGTACLLSPQLAMGQTPADLSGPRGEVISRPHLEGAPTEVSVGLYFLDVSQIDDIAQEFAADVVVRLIWRDPRLADPGAPPTRVLPLAEIWNPEVGFLNRRAVDLLLPEAVQVDPAGQIVYLQRALATLASPLDLRFFPSDEQDLGVQLVSYRYAPAELDLRVDTTLSGRLEVFSITGWTVELGPVDVVPLALPGADLSRAGMTFRLTAQRERMYYVLIMFLPLVLIALMAWCVFWIDPSLLPSQIAISTASVFTLIAFRFSVSFSLPRISYLTVADQFILAITLLVFIALGQAVLTGRLAKSGKEAFAGSLDRWGRWIYVVILAILCGWVLV
jgi:hypothetical protein